MHMKGEPEFDIDYIYNQKMFGNDDIRHDVDATIILGNFSMEKLSLPPKILLSRLNRMFANDKYSLKEKNAMGQSIYEMLNASFLWIFRQGQ